MNRILLLMTAVMLHACKGEYPEGSFASDLDYMSRYKEVIVLKSEDGNSQVAIIPDYQGRVMTSTSEGPEGQSYGWINHDLVGSGTFEEHINVFGGEDRFWLGPEGGQFSIFFKEGSSFDFENWFTPKPIDTEPFTLVDQGETHARFHANMEIVNYQGTVFNLHVDREIQLLSGSQVEEELDIDLEGVSFVAFQSVNTIKNAGTEEWKREKGLLSIWILGMFVPSDGTMVILPYKDSLQLNTAYFGEISDDRLAIHDQAVLFKGDGKYRSKIGLPPRNVYPYLGSYNPVDRVLTIVKYTFNDDTCYVNSLWEHQEHPYAGDVINSYNDGPLDDGTILGPFYELESSSPAKELQPEESLQHVHTTFHFEGAESAMDKIAVKLLGIHLEDVVIAE